MPRGSSPWLAPRPAVEFLFLRQYDESRRRLREVVDLPNRPADLFIRLCCQNKGTLSQVKRGAEEFAKLTNGEIRQLEAAVRDAFGLPGCGDAMPLSLGGEQHRTDLLGGQ